MKAIDKYKVIADEKGKINLSDGTFLELIAECDKPYVAHQKGNWKTGIELIEAYTPAAALKRFKRELAK